MAAEANRKPGFDRVDELLRSELSQRFLGARIELTGPVRWTRGAYPADAAQLLLQNLTARGEAQFTVLANDRSSSEGFVTYAAWMPAQIALKRVLPGEALNRDMFAPKEINVATGQGFEYRGLILGAETEIEGLESRQTVLEGQFLTSTAVQKIPDVRRGDSVRVHLVSGDLTVSTLGTASEPAYVNGRVRVMATKSKREFVGQLMNGGVVEVRL